MSDILINGPAGRIEGRFSRGKRPEAPIALVLHPHPLYGGTMNNKLVFALHQAFHRHGFATLRFNYRGVGRSQGQYQGGEGELADATSALEWLQMHHPQAEGCWIAGYSFGAWIGMQLLMRRPGIGRFVVVAPPVNLYDFGFLAPCPASGLILQGTRDELVPEAGVDSLVRKLSNQRDIRIDYRPIEGADHFFADRLDEVRRHLEDYLGGARSPGAL